MSGQCIANRELLRCVRVHCTLGPVSKPSLGAGGWTCFPGGCRRPVMLHSMCSETLPRVVVAAAAVEAVINDCSAAGTRSMRGWSPRI